MHVKGAYTFPTIGPQNLFNNLINLGCEIFVFIEGDKNSKGPQHLGLNNFGRFT